MVVGELTLQGFETNLLQQNITVGIGQYFLVDAVVPIDRCAGQLVSGNTRVDGIVFEGAVALLFGEKIASVGDYKPEIAGASLVHAGKINFIDDPMAERKPDFAVLVQSGADTGFGA